MKVQPDMSGHAPKKSALSRLWWLWSFLLTAIVIDICIGLWFFLGKDVNSLHDPYSMEALEVLLARMWWAFPVASLIGFLGPGSLFLGRYIRKSSTDL